MTFTKTELEPLAAEIEPDTISKGKETSKAATSLPSGDTIAVSTAIDGICDFNLIAKMSKLGWKMYDSVASFGNMQINQFETRLELSGPKTDLKVKLKEITINYDNNLDSRSENEINCNYRQIISCTAEDSSDNFFDFNLLFNAAPSAKKKDLITLRVGKIKVICLVKFVNELVTFFDPIITSVSSTMPSLTEQVKEQALEAVKNVYQETQIEGKKIFLDIHVQSPQVIIPKNSTSSGAFLVDLGNLTITNRFLEEAPTDRYRLIIKYLIANFIGLLYPPSTLFFL